MSIVRSGLLGSKRRSSTPLQGMSVTEGDHQDNKRLKFLNIRNAFLDINIEVVPNVLVGDLCAFGSGLFSFALSREHRNPAYDGSVYVGYGDRKITKYNLDNRKDLSAFQVSLSDSRTDCESVFWDDSSLVIEQRNYLLAKRVFSNWLIRMSDHSSLGDIRFRMLRSTTVPGSKEMDEFLTFVRSWLNADIRKKHKFIRDWDRLRSYNFKTYGQMILAMMREGGHLSCLQIRSTLKPRIMLLWFEVLWLCTRNGGPGSDVKPMLTGLYEWMVIGTCDSCMEKVLLSRDSEGPLKIEYPYTINALVLREERFLGIVENRGLDYEIISHAPDGSQVQDCLAWKTWEHSFIRPRFIGGEITFTLPSTDGDRIEIPLPQHLGMSLISCLEGLHRGIKAAASGYGSQGLIIWARDGGWVSENLDRLYELIIDNLLITDYRNDLYPMVVNVVGILTLCAFPKSLVTRVRSTGFSGDFFDMITKWCFSTQLEEHYSIISEFANMGIEARRARLRQPDFQLTLIHYTV